MSYFEKSKTIINIVKQIAQWDYELIIFHGVKKREDGKPGYAGDTKFKNIGFIQSKINVFPFNIRYDKGMFKEFKKINPDILIIQGITGNISYRMCNSWAKRKKKLIIGWTCGFEPGIAKGMLLKFKNSLVSNFFKKADYFLTYSSNSSKYVESLGIDNKKIETCYNGIEIDDLVENKDKILNNAREIRKKHALDGFITFLYVGALTESKKVDLQMDAFVKLREKYDNIKMIIIGEGPLRPYVEEKAKDDKENIIFLGRIYDGVDDYFAASDCFVLPGTGGLGLNQAMFWEKLCIASDGADGTQEDLIFDNESGYRFEKENVDSLVDAMERRINESPEKLAKMTEYAHRIIIEKSNVNNMVKVFQTTINKFMQ